MARHHHVAFSLVLIAGAACSNGTSTDDGTEQVTERFVYDNSTYQDAPITDLELSMEMHVDSLNTALNMLEQ